MLIACLRPPHPVQQMSRISNAGDAAGDISGSGGCKWGRSAAVGQREIRCDAYLKTQDWSAHGGHNGGIMIAGSRNVEEDGGGEWLVAGTAQRACHSATGEIGTNVCSVPFCSVPALGPPCPWSVSGGRCSCTTRRSCGDGVGGPHLLISQGSSECV